LDIDTVDLNASGEIDRELIQGLEQDEHYTIEIKVTYNHLNTVFNAASANATFGEL